MESKAYEAVKKFVEEKREEEYGDICADESLIAEVTMRFPIPEQLQEARIALSYQDQNILLYEIKQMIFELLDEGYCNYGVVLEKNGEKLEIDAVLEQILEYINREVAERGIMFLP